MSLSKEVEKEIGKVETKKIVEVFQKTNGNITETAKLLGITKVTLYRKMAKYGIEVEKKSVVKVNGKVQP